ncbi:hypothetical protein BRD12_02455 [Halobacteriales archaeon SW_12_67_38]|nr:MAG: hypothetical protein BRC80_06665 [Halobacteriales archaeon QH_9_66_26]PSQ53623.1 MAG: hypothetical protein BRD12_02455 [Halobacteriales archaeon SW_12_67_38]
MYNGWDRSENEQMTFAVEDEPERVQRVGPKPAGDRQHDERDEETPETHPRREVENPRNERSSRQHEERHCCTEGDTNDGREPSTERFRAVRRHLSYRRSCGLNDNSSVP